MKKHYNLDPEQIMFDTKRFLQSRYHTDPQKSSKRSGGSFMILQFFPDSFPG